MGIERINAYLHMRVVFQVLLFSIFPGYGVVTPDDYPVEGFAMTGELPAQSPEVD